MYSNFSLYGYYKLIELYNLNSIGPMEKSYISNKSKIEIYEENGITIKLYPQIYATEDSFIGHILFALKNEGINLSIISELFDNVDKTKLILHYRRRGDKKYHDKIMEFDRNFNIHRAEIGQNLTQTAGKIEYYLSAKLNGKEIFFPKKGVKNPITIDVSNDFTAPKLTYHFKKISSPPRQIKIVVKAADKSGIKSLRLFYKELPSYLEWHSVKMKAAGSGNYEATVPLNSRGLMYHFEALDAHNNGAIYPDPQIERPYFVIKAWEKK